MLLKLIRLSAARMRTPDAYREMQACIAEWIVSDLYNRGIDCSTLCGLELGAGYGGYSLVFFKHFNHFVASDIYKDDCFTAGRNIPFEIIDVQRSFPFESERFDFVFAISLIEHVDRPRSMLKEIRRILKPGGLLLLSFPPYYSLSMVGGHSFKPFHLLGEQWAIVLTNLFRRTNYKKYADCYGNCGLWPYRIDQVKQMVTDSRFELKDVYTRMCPLKTTRFPGLLKDLFTWHACFLAVKTN